MFSLYIEFGGEFVVPFRAAAVGVLQALFGAFHADGGLSAESHKVTLWLLARCGADGCLTCGTKT